MFSFAGGACSATPASEAAASPSAHCPPEHHLDHCCELTRHSTPSEPTGPPVPWNIFALWQDCELTTLEKAFTELLGSISANLSLVFNVGKPIHSINTAEHIPFRGLGDLVTHDGDSLDLAYTSEELL